MDAQAPAKYIVRNLPPTMLEATFRSMLQNVLKDDLQWFRYQQGHDGYALMDYSCTDVRRTGSARVFCLHLPWRKSGV